MKIILSHDVDHLYWQEHYFKDLYLFGTVFRNTKGLIKGDIDFKLYLKRLKCWGRIHRLVELSNFYGKNNIKANFFFGMSNALHLSYKYRSVTSHVNKLISEGHKVGTHGISFSNARQIDLEYRRFKEISNLNAFGIRNHYLRLNGYTHNLFDQQGYLFDSTIESIMHPFKINDMWEIPISIMDASLVVDSQLNQNLEIWKSNTLLKLEKAIKSQIPYFVINFHDPFFSEDFPVIKEWFIWLVNFFKKESYIFITFEEAVKELNGIN